MRGTRGDDQVVTRAIHRLYWRANLQDKKNFITWLLTRPPANLIYDILVPIQIAYGVQAIVTRDFDAVSGHAITILLLAISYCALWAIGGLAIIRCAAIGSSYVQRVVFSNYLQKDYEFYNNTYFGALGEQATRVRDALNDYNHVLILQAPRQFVIVGAGIVVIAYQSWMLALVTLVAMVIVLSYTLWSGAWRIKFRRILSMANSEVAGVIGDALSHGSTVKSFAAEGYEEKRLNVTLKDWVQKRWASWASSIPADVGQAFLAALTICVLLVLTGRLYQQEVISIAIVALIQLYVIKMISATQDIAELIKSYEGAMASAYQPVKTMLVEATIKDPERPRRLPKNKRLEIDFKSAEYRYPGTAPKARAVRNFNLTITKGQKIGLVGYSGSGKTTLTKLLVRFMDVSSGSIEIDGIDIRELSQHELRRHIAYVPQEPLLFHRTIFENIAYGRPSAPKKAVEAAGRMAYVDEFVRELPTGYDTYVGERGVKLSGGQRQRVAIARAILKDAPVLVLDEATSALDSRSEKLIQKALWRLMKDRTALVIAHRLSTIQRMDQIVVMDKGKIVQIGTHNELLQDKKGIYAKLWTHQSGGYIGVSENKPSAQKESVNKPGGTLY